MRSRPVPLYFKRKVAGGIQSRSSGVFFKHLLKFNERGRFPFSWRIRETKKVWDSLLLEESGNSNFEMKGCLGFWIHGQVSNPCKKLCKIMKRENNTVLFISHHVILYSPNIYNFVNIFIHLQWANHKRLSIHSFSKLV